MLNDVDDKMLMMMLRVLDDEAKSLQKMKTF